MVALKDKKLLPVAELDRGFIHPEYPEQVIVSYFQAGRICDYIQERWGADKLLDMVHAFAELKPTPDVIQQVLGMAPEEFDEQFLAWLYKDVGPIVDEVRRVAHAPEAPGRSWSTARQYDEVLKEGEAVRRLYPEYVEDANAYEFLAEIEIAKGDKAGAHRGARRLPEVRRRAIRRRSRSWPRCRRRRASSRTRPRRSTRSTRSTR